MKKINFKFIILFTVLVVICFASFFVSNEISDIDYTQDNLITEKQIESIPNRTIKRDIQELPSITIKAGETIANITIIPGQNLYEILQNKTNNNLIPFKGKDYSGLGFFVTEIGTLRSSKGKYLFYNINGVEATQGISSYIPKEGDVIDWELR